MSDRYTATPCETCQWPRTVTSGACGVWVRCTGCGAERQVTTPALRKARLALITAADADRDAARVVHAREFAAALSAAGVDPRR